MLYVPANGETFQETFRKTMIILQFNVFLFVAAIIWPHMHANCMSNYMKVETVKCDLPTMLIPYPSG